VNDDPTITAALQKASPLPFAGYTYRVIDDNYRGDPLSGVGSVNRGGRYNPPHSFEVMYCSDSRVTALTEVEAIFGDIDQPRSPEIMLTLDVQLTRLLDLTDPDVRQLIATTEEQLTEPYIEDQLRSGESHTQRLGRLIFATRRFSGLRVPSAARPGANNLVVLPARFAHDESVRIYDERGRWRQVRIGAPT
jgi:RES domain-containing protein